MRLPLPAPAGMPSSTAAVLDLTADFALLLHTGLAVVSASCYSPSCSPSMAAGGNPECAIQLAASPFMPLP